MLDTASTSNGWVIAIVRALDHYGIDSKPLLWQAGIDLNEAQDPNGRYPVSAVAKLTQLAVNASGDEAFGLTLGRMMRPTSWHALGFSVWASATLREGFERVVRYFKVFTTVAVPEIDEAEGRYTLRGSIMPAYEPILHYAEYEAFIAAIVLTARHLRPEGLTPIEVGLPRPEGLVDPTPFQRLFQCPVRFGQPNVYLVLDSRDMDTPLPTANPELAQRNDQICAEYIARFDRQDTVSQVYYRLMTDLPNGEPAMEEIASALHMSLRTLQRKLQDQDTSYKQLLDEVRHELALQYMRQPHLSIGEISYMLGFSQVSNFSRAFKRWTGLPPADYRNLGK